MSQQGINNIQEEDKHLSPLFTGGFILNFPELQNASTVGYARMNVTDSRTLFIIASVYSSIQ
jgi:hypothetical protein